MGQICKCMSCGHEHELDDVERDDENLKEYEMIELNEAELRWFD